MSGNERLSVTHEPRMSIDAGSSFATERIGYQPEYTLIAHYRRNMRAVMDTLWFEGLTIVLVMVYAVILFWGMASSPEAEVDPPICFSITTAEQKLMVIENNATLTSLCSLVEERGVLYVLDFTFLSIFMVEIVFRLAGYGISFLRGPVQLIDSVVVTLAFIANLLPQDTIAAGRRCSACCA